MLERLDVIYRASRQSLKLFKVIIHDLGGDGALRMEAEPTHDHELRQQAGEPWLVTKQGKDS